MTPGKFVEDAENEENKIEPRQCEFLWWVWDMFMSIWRSEKSKTSQSEKDEDDVCQCCGNPDPKSDLY